MSRITMCLDCPEYQKGGYCRHKHKEIGALSPACDYAIKMNEKFNLEDEEAPLEQAGPQPDQTPQTSPEAERRAEKNQRRREVRMAMVPLPAKIERKRCPHCGLVLPLSEYYLKDGKPNWICKECTKAYNVAKAKERRDAKSAEQNAGAATKVCKTCGRELPLDAFSSHPNTWDRKTTVCTECLADRLRKNRKNRTKKEDTMTDQEIQSAILMPDTEAVMNPKTSGEPNVSPIPGSGCMPAPKHSPNVSPIEPRPETTAEHRPRQDPRLENFESKALADELRARGYRVTAARPITIIEEL